MNYNDIGLKFRMWNEGLEKMTYFDNPHFHLSIESPDNARKVMKHLFAFDIAKNSDLYFGEYKIVMQSIDLLDREGKQAYEDDVIEFQSTEGQLYRKRIKWDDKLLCYLIGNMPYQKIFESAYFHIHQNFLILGNIYENPELLEAENDKRGNPHPMTVSMN